MLNFSLKQLRLFVTIAQQGSLTRASETLFMSKPAVSIALAELEKQLDCSLFHRHKNRLVLNDAGQRLLPLAVELLDRSEALKSVAHVNELTGRLQIGASYTIGNYLLPFLLAEFRTLTDHHKQTLHISNTQEIIEHLKAYRLDVGLVEGEASWDELMVHKWRTDQMLIVCQPNHPLTKIKHLSFNTLAQYEWILRETGSGTRAYFDRHIAPNLTLTKPIWKLTAMEAIINATIAGLGISCLSQLAVQNALDRKQLVSLDIPLKPRQYWLVYAKEKYQSPLLKAFIDCCLKWSI